MYMYTYTGSQKSFLSCKSNEYNGTLLCTPFLPELLS